MWRFLIVIALLAWGCYDNFDTPTSDDEDISANATISELRKLYSGTPFEIKNDIVIGGYVTSSDRSGNFFRTFTIEDQGAAVEIMAGIDGLHNSYPIGRRVVVRLEGLTVGESYGILQIGRKPDISSGFPTDYIGSKIALDKIVFRGKETLPITAVTTTITSLTRTMCGTLIRIDNLRYTPELLEPMSWAGYKKFSDPDNNVIYIYTRNYADFANNQIPAGTLSVIGILQYAESGTATNHYILKIRDEQDCIN